MGDEGKSSETDSFTSAMTLNQTGLAQVPPRFVLPSSERPGRSLLLNPSTTTTITPLPIIDISSLHNPSLRPRVIEEIRVACEDLGFFQVINHGIPSMYANDAIDAATEFFNLPSEEKMHLASTDVRKPVRYGTGLNHIEDKVHFWRDFIKHYCHPISTWIHLWPSNPSSYKEKMGNYAKAVQALQEQLKEAVLQSLGLKADYLHEDFEKGTQVMVVNCYPACPEPDLALGMPPHSDYGSLTILTQSQPGFEIMDKNNNWRPVPVIEGAAALLVLLGDQMEVISNGRYKSVVHRATLNKDRTRISIASLHSLALDKKVGPAPELIDDEHPLAYNEGSFESFLDHISGNDARNKVRYIDMLKRPETIKANCMK
ncbi:hypothetical protein RHSIM_Rhsim03G0034200 [Rhododendron simsii]|uniref:Fe2OG dioxygenase domain-containing protein n=1 Tax=Rhododendron simsii TaxID=118357 RepID=A0A834LPD6_RHOSS|nr:hypothetical protein RHSIM_Rhsim03G0034200 [Rhododendron simsii]